MKQDPEDKYFIQLGTVIIQKKTLTSHVAVNFLDETNYLLQYITCYPNLEVQYSNISLIDLIS